MGLEKKILKNPLLHGAPLKKKTCPDGTFKTIPLQNSCPGGAWKNIPIQPCLGSAQKKISLKKHVLVLSIKYS